jgi:amino ABC transporter, permease protein, 3-TM region, his/glu/gln/arg/opine family
MIIATQSIGMFEKSWNIFQQYYPLFWYGIKITLLLAILGTVFGLVLGLFLGGIRAIKIEERDKAIVKVIKKILHAIVAVYVWFFRGTPMMVQAMFFYYSLRSVIGWTPLVAGIIIISVNTGAYMAEIIRSGIQSIDKGQIEGARSLGMTSTQTMMSIVLPQAIRNSLPSIGNELIVNIKDSSMLNVISVTDLYFQTSSVAGSTYATMETFLVACVLYLLLTTLATWIINFAESRLSTPKVSGVKKAGEA